jgi:hypothetical protein
MSASLLPNAELQFIDSNGSPLAGGKVYYYIPNTSTLKSTYQDSAQTILNTNPIVLDAAGRAIVWGSGAYRQVVYDQFGNLVWDQVTQDANAGLIGNMTDKRYVAGTDFTPGTTTQLALPSAPGTLTNMWVFFDAAYQADDQMSVVGTTLTFNSPIPVGVQEVNVKIGSTVAVGTPAAGSITDNSIASGTKLYNRINDIIDVKDYGAVGNGTTDDTAAFNLAVAAAASKGGATVFVPAGNYLLSSTILLSIPNVSIEGDSPYSATIRVPSGATGFAGYNPNAVFVINADNCGIRSLGMNGNIANNASLSFGAIANTTAVSGIFVEDCYIHDFIYNGIILNPLTGTTTNFHIDRNRVENVGWGGITAYCCTHGTINDNSVTSCGASGIQTDANPSTGNTNITQSVTIDGNYVTKAVPPTHIVSAAAETGFLIGIGAGDSYITISNNLCFDNRNAVYDGIGLGQDGTHVNEGLIFDSNVVVYAGLYGIDVASNHVVSNNYIRFSAQQGIKLGTDTGGNLVNATVTDNIIDGCNFAGLGSNQGIWVAATLTVGLPTALYANIKISGNRVVDYAPTPHTVYGLGIDFKSGLTYQNCDFSYNDFSQLAGTNGNGLQYSGSITASVGWSYKGNKHPSPVPTITGPAPVVLGLDAAAISQSGATGLQQINGIYSGQEITFQMADGNTTWFPGGNILTHAGASLPAAANSIWKLFTYSGGCYLNQFFTP